MPEPDLHARVRACADRVAASMADASLPAQPVTAVSTVGGVTVYVTVRSSAYDNAHLTGCERAILEVLQRAFPNRLMTQKVIEALESTGYRYADSTVTHRLAALAKRGLVESRDRAPFGYLFVTWPVVPGMLWS